MCGGVITFEYSGMCHSFESASLKGLPLWITLHYERSEVWRVSGLTIALCKECPLNLQRKNAIGSRG